MSTATYGNTVVFSQRRRTRKSPSLDQQVFCLIFGILGFAVAVIAILLVFACFLKPAKTMVANTSLQTGAPLTTLAGGIGGGAVVVEKIAAQFGDGLNDNVLLIRATIKNNLPYEVNFPDVPTPVSIGIDGKWFSALKPEIGGIRPGEREVVSFMLPIVVQPGTHQVRVALNLAGARRPEPGIVILDGPIDICNAQISVTKYDGPMARRIAAR